MSTINQPLVIVVGAGGVGKTTLAAALALQHARCGDDTLVMTFDPSHRLKDTLGIGQADDSDEVEVDVGGPGRLVASLLDSRRTFNRLVDRYADTQATRDRILTNRFYDHLSGSLAGVLEYMASERLYEVAHDNRFDRIVLDTPPTKQALDFLQAPDRIVGFLETGGPKMAAKKWFDDEGHLRGTRKLGFLGRNVEAFFDRTVGLELLRDMSEFFQAFAPLFDGFRERAAQVQKLLRSQETVFVLVSAPGPQRVADPLFFARRLEETGYHLGAVVVNRVHPLPDNPQAVPPMALGSQMDGRTLIEWIAIREAEGVAHLRDLMGNNHPVVELGLRPDEPTGVDALEKLGAALVKGIG